MLPRFTTPLAVACCWLLVGLLATSLGLAWLCRVPATASGPVVVAADDARMGFVFLPPDEAGDIRAGDAVVLRFGSETIIRPLATVDAVASSPDAARLRPGRTAGLEVALDGPVIVATVRLDGVPAGLATALYPGATGRAEIETGSRRVASLIPFVARFVD